MAQTDEFMLPALAEIGAIRNVIVHSLALRLLEEPDPQQTLAMLNLQLTAQPTQPAPNGGRLDPAMSDMLAALTDDRTQALVGDIGERLDAFIQRG